MTGNRLCSIALLFVGLNVFASGMFTALSRHAVLAHVFQHRQVKQQSGDAGHQGGSQLRHAVGGGVEQHPSPEDFGYCRTYLSNYLLFTIPILLMYNFSLYLIAADKSTLRSWGPRRRRSR